MARYFSEISPEAKAIVETVIKQEQTTYSRQKVHEVNLLRNTLQTRFNSILSLCKNDEGRTIAIGQACIVVMRNENPGDTTRPDAAPKMLGNPDTLILRLVCLNVLVTQAKRSWLLREFSGPMAAIAKQYLDDLAEEVTTATQSAYARGMPLTETQKRIVRLHIDMELLLPSSHPSRQSLYAADTGVAV